MNLFIPLYIASVKIISPGSDHPRIPPLPYMKRSTNIRIWVTHLGNSTKFSLRLHILLSPVDCYGNKEGDQNSTQNWVAINESIDGSNNTAQRKEIPPNKPQGFLCFYQSWLCRIHQISLPIYYQNSIAFPENIPQKTTTINRTVFLCIFQDTPYITGENAHEP